MCRQQSAQETANASNVADRAQDGDNSNYAVLEDGVGSVVGGRGRKRNHLAGPDFGASSRVDSSSGGRANFRQGGRVPVRVSEQPAAGAEVVSSGANEDVKVEVANDGSREGQEPAAISGSCSSSRSSKRARRPARLISRASVAESNAAPGEEDAGGVKLELEVASPPPA